MHSWRVQQRLIVTLLIAIMAAATASQEPQCQTLSLQSTVKLRRGDEMPLFGLGTWLSEGGGTCKKAVTVALEHGYRLIDTATMYQNEADVGEALKEGSKSSKGIYIVSKLQPSDHGREAAMQAIDRTLTDLKVDKLDLWLMHSPTGGKVVETWKAMLEARDAGKVTSVGVSNVGPAQIEGLRAAGCELPEVNQFELHVWNQQREAVEYCRSNGIVVMSYCPLARCKLFGQTDLAALSEKLGRSEAQLCIRWLLERGFVTIPKSTNAERIRANADVFDWSLSEEELAEMDALDQGFLASNAVKAMWKPWEEVA